MPRIPYDLWGLPWHRFIIELHIAFNLLGIFGPLFPFPVWILALAATFSLFGARLPLVAALLTRQCGYQNLHAHSLP